MKPRHVSRLSSLVRLTSLSLAVAVLALGSRAGTLDLAVRGRAPDPLALPRAEFAKYYRQIVGKEMPEGLVRFVIEYFREPDSQIGFIIALGRETEPTALFKSFLNISLGQIFCLAMIIGGAAIIIWSLRTQPVVYAKARKKGKGKRK